jgi:hypothetical protein
MDVSMKPKHDHKKLPQATSEESRKKQRMEKFNERLRECPELLAQFESILAIASETGPDGHFRTADEVEALTIEAVRKLGQQTMQQWAQAAQERAVEDCRQEHPTARIKKKAR